MGRDSLQDDIEIVGRSRRGKVRIVQLEIDDGSADEGVVQPEAIEAISDRAQGREIRRRHGRSGVAKFLFRHGAFSCTTEAESIDQRKEVVERLRLPR